MDQQKYAVRKRNPIGGLAGLKFAEFRYTPAYLSLLCKSLTVHQSAAMVLAKALVDREKDMDMTYDPEKGHILPEIPLHEARQIMTRADFIQSYDHINVFTIDSRAMVRAGEST